MERIFKNIVLLSTLLTITLWVLPYFNYANFTDEEFDILSWSGYGASLPASNTVYWGLLIAWLVTNLGLYFFITPFRAIFTFLTIVTGICGLFWGMSIYPAIEFTIYNILTMLDGSILTMLYLTSISTKFNKTLTNSSSGTAKPHAAP